MWDVLGEYLDSDDCRFSPAAAAVLVVEAQEQGVQAQMNRRSHDL